VRRPSLVSAWILGIETGQAPAPASSGRPACEEWVKIARCAFALPLFPRFAVQEIVAVHLPCPAGQRSRQLSSREHRRRPRARRLHPSRGSTQRLRKLNSLRNRCADHYSRKTRLPIPGATAWRDSTATAFTCARFVSARRADGCSRQLGGFEGAQVGVVVRDPLRCPFALQKDHRTEF